jgi:succinylglutamate desuccinylase
MQRIFKELENFSILKEQLKDQGHQVLTLDDHGFSIGQKNKEIDLLVTGLMHGDEVVGIEIINSILTETLRSNKKFSISIAFLLCNIEAAKASKRFIQTDLNRSFLVKDVITTEHKRAVEIASIVKRSKFILDLHQTIEPTEKEFFIFEHIPKLIKIAHSLLPEIPIVTFSLGGFSESGKTVLEFATTVGSTALAIECGEKGYNPQITTKIVKLIYKLINKLELNDLPETTESIEVNNLSKSIVNEEGSYLIKGLKNHMKLIKGQLIGYRANGAEITVEDDCYLYFPRYGEYAKIVPTLCELGKTCNYTEV